MSSSPAAFCNGTVLAVLIAAAVWLAMQLISRRLWNASTRYVIWWVTMLAAICAPLLYMPTAGAPSVRQRVTAQEVRSPAATTARPPLAATLKIAPTAPNWLGLLWLALTAILLHRLFLSLVRLVRLKARAFATPPALVEAADEWLSHCGSKRKGVGVALSNEIATPMAVGFRRAMILFPAKVVHELDAQSINAIGIHEAAHLARYDDIAILPQRLMRALFPWNPVILFISRCLDKEREIACDDVAVRATGSATAFAKCLTTLAEREHVNLYPLTSAIAGRSHLSTRVDLLLSKTRPRRVRLVYSQVGTAVATVAVLLAVASQGPGLIAIAAQQRLGKSAVSVTDPKNRFVTGLQKEHFRLTENGVDRDIVQFIGSDNPMSVVIAIDVRSFAHRASAKEAAAILTDRLNGDGTDEITTIEAPFETAVGTLRLARYPRKIVVCITDAPGNRKTSPDRDIEVFAVNPGMPQFIEFVHKVGVQLRNEYVVVYNSGAPDAQAELQMRAPAGLPELKGILLSNSRSY